MSMAQPPNYQFMVAEKWQNNLENVAVKLNRGDSDLLQQIQKFAYRFGYDQTQVENMIHREPMFAACFAKSPSHQRIHEKIAVEWLESELDIQIKIRKFPLKCVSQPSLFCRQTVCAVCYTTFFGPKFI